MVRRKPLLETACWFSAVLFWAAGFLSTACGESQGDNSCLFPLHKGARHDNGATPWFAKLFLGTPDQAMTAMMDTGTANFWVTSSSCDSPACGTKQHTYDPGASKTGQSIPAATWQHNDLGSWGQFESLAVSDKVSFMDPARGRMELTMKFLTARLQDAPGSSNWRELDMCGGVGFPVVFHNPHEANRPGSLLPSLVQAGWVSQPVVSFWTDAETGGCVLGRMDPSKYKADTRNDIPLTGIAARLNLWTVPLEQVLRNTTPMLERPVHLALDTGSSRFKGSPRLIRRLIEQITTKPDGENLPATFSDPALLDQFPTLTLVINGHRYTLEPRDYIWKIAGTGVYSLQFHPLDIGDDNTILVGSVLLDHLYAAFEYAPDEKAPGGLQGNRVLLFERN